MLSEPNVSSLQQIFIYETHFFFQLYLLWNTFQSKLADESSYTTSIGKIRLYLQKLQEQNDFA